MALRFNTQWDYDYVIPSLAVGESSDSLVDDLSYRSVKDQIEAFMVAGARLDAFRSGYYDEDLVGQGESILDLDIPIGRAPYSDFSDVQAAVNEFSESVHSRSETLRKAKEKAMADDTAELKKLRAQNMVKTVYPAPASAPISTPPAQTQSAPEAPK